MGAQILGGARRPPRVRLFLLPRLIVTSLAAVAVVSSGSASAQSANEDFNPGAAGGSVAAIALQPDGKILVGGWFTKLGGGATIARNYLGRLNPDGSLDTGFNPGANGAIRGIAVQPDGKIVVGGEFTRIGGGGTGTTLRARLARLNPDGSVDPTFDPGADFWVEGLVLQPDGKILVGGGFTRMGGGGSGTWVRHHIARLLPDGSLDMSFNPGASDWVRDLAVQRDGKIVVGGSFRTIGGGGRGNTGRLFLARLHPDGSVDPTFHLNPDGDVQAVALQADGKILVGGYLTYNGGLERTHVRRINPDGTFDADFNVGFYQYIDDIVMQPDGKIVLAHRYGLDRLLPTGRNDRGFWTSTNGAVYSIAVQPDGRVVMGGVFGTVKVDSRNGGPSLVRPYLARVHSDGVLEVGWQAVASGSVRAVALQADQKVVFGGATFGTDNQPFNVGRVKPIGPAEKLAQMSGIVDAVSLQPDGRVLVGGEFVPDGESATPRYNLARLDTAGLLDASFNPGADGRVEDLVVQRDGRILVAGTFSRIGGGGTGSVSRRGVARLHADGGVDLGFDPRPNGSVHVVALQPDGRILVGGGFTAFGEGTASAIARPHLARLHADGSVDTTFDVALDGEVYAIVLQPDGRILLGGGFTMIGTTQRHRLARLNSDGSIDATFNPGADADVRSIALQTNGKIVIGGNFTGVGSGWGEVTRKRVARLNADGTVDASYDTSVGADGLVHAVAIGHDGTVIVGGEFQTLSGSSRPSFGRLANNEPPHERIEVRTLGRTIVWMRGGSAREIDRVTFEMSTDGGATYISWGEGARIPGGWRIHPVYFPWQTSGVFVRARGYSATGTREVIANVYVTRSTAAFTDDPLVAKSTIVGAVHISELRARIDRLREDVGLQAFTWTDPVIGPGVTARAIHLIELRTALEQAYTVTQIPLPVFTDAASTLAGTAIKATHIRELRAAVLALE